MALEKKRFVRYSEEKKDDLVTIRLNPEQRDLLNKVKKLIEQERDSTAIHILWDLGADVILEGLSGKAINKCFKNRRNNRRRGIDLFDD